MHPFRQFPARGVRPAGGHHKRLRTAFQPQSTGFELVDDQEALRHRFLTYTFSRLAHQTRPIR